MLRGFGAYHGIELLYLFDHLDALGYSPTPGERALGDAIIASWRSLAATGDPGAPASVPWPRYDGATDSYLGLDDPIAQGAGVRTAQCDFWDDLVP